MKQALLLPFLLISLLFIISHSKVISDVEYLAKFDKKSSWSYLTKFAISPGQGSFKAKAQFYKPIHASGKNAITMRILAYTDDDWDRVREMTDCKQRAAQAKVNLPLEIPTGGAYSEYVEGELYQQKIQMWYFVLSDCEKNVSPYAMGNRVRWEIQALNSDNSHFGEDERAMAWPLFLVMVVIIAFFVLNSIKFWKFYKQEEGIDYPTLITTIALFLEFLSILCELLHLWIYAYDGKGSAFFNFMNQALSISSQFLITCLLLLIANGWSISSNEFEDMEIFIPLGILLGVMHIIIVGVGRITDNEHYRYHDYENWAGIVVIVLRMLFYIFWIYLFYESYKVAKGPERDFYKKFGVFASIYFLAFPVLVVFSTIFVAPYSKHEMVTLGSLFLQTVTLVIFTLLFTTKKTGYYQVSLKGKMLLPTNKLS